MDTDPFLKRFILILSFCWCSTAQNVFVLAPNTFRLGSDETVGLTVYKGTEDVTLSLQDFPGRKNTFSKLTVTVSENDPKIVPMRVNPEDIPDLALSTALSKHYALLVVEGARFRKEIKVLVGLQSGYLFVQTDKPIYTPEQTVHARVIPLDEDLLPDNQTFTLQIRNPQNIIVQNEQSGHLNVENGIFNYNFKFPPGSLHGDWSVVILYGHKVPRNETVTFEMREYSLPTYEVKLKIPEVILPNEETIDVKVEAKYVYGKMVDGSVTCRFGVKSETQKTIYFGRTDIIMLQKGNATCTVHRMDFEKHKQVGWFPRIAGSHFVAEATVTEKATGEEEITANSKSVFSQTKYLVDFKRCLRDFKAGLVATVVADIKDVSGNKAAGIPVAIQVKNQQGVYIRVENQNAEDLSDSEGRVKFMVSTDQSTTSLHITVTTQDPDLDIELQGKNTHFMTGQNMGFYVALERTSIKNSVKVGDDFLSNVYSQPHDLAISYAVTSSGRILTLGSLAAASARQRAFRLQITDEMVPSIRVTLFAVHNGKTLTDSIKMDVENVCREKAKIVIESDFKSPEPGALGAITVKGTADTVVGLLAVDKAVYVLRNQGVLNKEKMFTKMEQHDLGCGPGGGEDSQQILANAGLILISDTVINAPERPSCSERRLHKRSIREGIYNKLEGQEAKCCRLGTYKDRQNRPCEDRADIVREFHKLEVTDLCAKTFLRCCLEAEPLHRYSHDRKPTHINVGNGNPGPDMYEFARTTHGSPDDLVFVDEQDDLDYEQTVQERKDFRETWIFQTGVIGSNNQLHIPANAPPSITTWVVQAVAINPLEGMCVADPLEVVVFKKIFLQVKLPYSVVRNEQIELRATIFNYDTQRMPVVVYMYGVEGLCSEAQPQEKSERKKVWVPGNGGSETVGFPVVPLQTGHVPIQIVALSPKGTDKLTKMLHVVAEGVPHEENIVFMIDPANLDKRKKRHIRGDKYETTIDEENKQQTSFVRLTPDQDYIPGTESCFITAIGDKFGATVHTAFTDPDKLIRLPVGCGEQNMAFLAPTLYTLHYLKVTGKMTPQQEKNGYKFIREGYQKELNFRKPDGSYAAFPNRPSSTWLTAFVGKVFCQANKYVFIDENSICSALDWLTKQQNQDGSFMESHPVVHTEMTGGVNGTIPMTAFVATTLFKCDCASVNLASAKEQAIMYLVEKLPTIKDPYHLAIVAYALSLADPAEAGYDANKRLLDIAHVDDVFNQRHWGVAGTSLSIEATSFALLTQLLHNNRDIAASIVNWLNTQRTAGGSFYSTQDTVVALEALSEYAIYARDPNMSLTCNITSSSDVEFRETLSFHTENARVLRSYELKKVGGRLNFEAMGTGVSTLGIKLSYNVPKKVEEICKFDIVVNVTDAKEIKNKRKSKVVTDFDAAFLNNFPQEMVDNLGIDPQAQNASNLQNPLQLPPPPPPDFSHRAQPGRGNMVRGPPGHSNPIRGPPGHGYPVRPLPGHGNPVRPIPGHIVSGRHSRVLDLDEVPQDLEEIVNQRDPMRRFKRRVVVNEAEEKVSNSKYFSNITVCVKYLHHVDSNMAVVDVGIFTGYRPKPIDLRRLVDDPALPIASYEEKGRSIIFYFDQISHVDPVCFWFRAERKFIVSHMESSVVKVYDYYRPEHTCSKFYSPNQHSAIIRTVCTGKVCQCAEGGCPPKSPFDKIMRVDDTLEQRRMLQEMACDRHQYVWKVLVENVEKDEASFQTVDVKVLKVLKAGRETQDDMLRNGPFRKFMGRRTCESGQLSINKEYIIMGNDQEPVEQDDGTLRYTYFINKQTSVYEWFKLSDRKIKKSVTEKNFHKIFMWVENQFIKNEGCQH